MWKNKFIIKLLQTKENLSNYLIICTVQKKFVEQCFAIKSSYMYSEKATKFCEISPLLLSTVHTDKSKGEILQNFVAFSEYMNFTQCKNRLSTVLRGKTKLQKLYILAYWVKLRVYFLNPTFPLQGRSHREGEGGQLPLQILQE